MAIELPHVRGGFLFGRLQLEELWRWSTSSVSKRGTRSLSPRRLSAGTGNPFDLWWLDARNRRSPLFRRTGAGRIASRSSADIIRRHSSWVGARSWKPALTVSVEQPTARRSPPQRLMPALFAITGALLAHAPRRPSGAAASSIRFRHPRQRANCRRTARPNGSPSLRATSSQLGSSFIRWRPALRAAVDVRTKDRHAMFGRIAIGLSTISRTRFERWQRCKLMLRCGTTRVSRDFRRPSSASSPDQARARHCEMGQADAGRTIPHRRQPDFRGSRRLM